MITKGERNYYIDVALFITALACMLSGILLDLRPRWMGIPLWFKPMHTYTGYVVAALVLAHLAVHGGWIGSVSGSIFRERRKVLVLALVVLLSIAACYLAATFFPETGGGHGSGWRYEGGRSGIPFGPRGGGPGR